MMGLTPRQRDALARLCADPDVSRAELARSLGVWPSSAQRLVNGLEERGYIRRHPNRARSIEIIPQPIVIKGERYRFIPVGRG